MTKYSKEILKDLYKTMVKIRLCEESFVNPILSGEIRCPVHLYTGEEAVAAGVCASLSKQDYVFGTHRSHGHFIAKGGSIEELVLEVYCKENGCSKGRGGSMHVIDPDNGTIGVVPIVGGTISLCVGAAMAIQLRKQNNVAVCFFGDGAVGEGVFYESLNFASLRKLPVLFVCENNLYSTHMPITECRSNQDIHKVGEPFGIRSYEVDGNDVMDVYEKTQEALEVCKSGEGPFLLECKTYRLRGHVGPDDNIQGTHTDIRPDKEIELWKKRDPILRFEKFLLNEEIMNCLDFENVNNAIETEVRKAHASAKACAYPDESELTRYVFK